MLSASDNELLTRTGPGTAMGNLVRQYWLPVLESRDLAPDGRPFRMRVLGESLIAFRDTQGNVGLLNEFCRHRNASLYWSRNEENGIRCVYHGWKYDTSGRCVDMPNEPASLTTTSLDPGSAPGRLTRESCTVSSKGCSTHWPVSSNIQPW
jgi:phthalate 4,5-dioxygenase oxygenase subunit